MENQMEETFDFMEILLLTDYIILQSKLEHCVFLKTTAGAVAHFSTNVQNKLPLKLYSS